MATSLNLPDIARRLYLVADSMDYMANLQAGDKSIGPWLQILASVVSDCSDGITSVLPEYIPDLRRSSGETP